MMNKKILSAAMALALTSASLTSMSSHALAVYMEKDSERYEQTVSEYNEKYVSYPELLDEINADLVGDRKDGYYTNVWRLDNGNDDNLFEGFFEYTHNDVLFLGFEEYVSEDELNDFLREIGLDEKDAYAFLTDPLTEGSVPGIFFLGDGDHVKLAEDITNAAKEKYGDKLRYANGSFGVIQFLQTRYIFTSWWARDEDGSLMNWKNVPFDRVNADLEANGYDVHFEPDTGRIVYPENYTIEEKIRLNTYLNKNHNIHLDTYTLCDANENGSKIDFLAENVKGDANLDGRTSVGDAVAILQSIGNRDKYELTEQGKFNADVDGVEGVTANDALTIQQWDSQGKL